MGGGKNAGRQKKRLRNRLIEAYNKDTHLNFLHDISERHIIRHFEARSAEKSNEFKKQDFSLRSKCLKKLSLVLIQHHQF